MTEKIVYRAQSGKQRDFIESDADITIYGGAKGSGKTFGLLIEAARWFPYSDINGTILRRVGEQFAKPGSIWQESKKIFGNLGYRANKVERTYYFNKTSMIKFDSCQYDDSAYNYQGGQNDFFLFDELGQFTQFQFFYIIGQLRTTSGKVRPYVKATCNPTYGWLADFLSWWIDEKTHYPIPERAGKTIWMIKMDDAVVWHETEEEANRFIARHNRKDMLKRSVCFIPATINDNQILLRNDPDYLATLSMLPPNERLNLMYGRWFFDNSGKLFKYEWFKLFYHDPLHVDCTLITCDTASSTKTANDYTVFQVWQRVENKIYLIYQYRGKIKATEQLQVVSDLIDKYNAQYVSVERASTGFYLIDELKAHKTVIVKEMTRDKDKYQRAYHVQQYYEIGLVHICPNREYYKDFIAEHVNFCPEDKNKQVHDDQVDASIDAVYHLLVPPILPVIAKKETNYLDFNASDQYAQL